MNSTVTFRLSTTTTTNADSVHTFSTNPVQPVDNNSQSTFPNSSRFWSERVYDVRPPVFVNNFLSENESRTLSASRLPLQAAQARPFYNFSVNDNGKFTRQTWDREFTCNICNDGVARDTKNAKRHNLAKHKRRHFESIMLERRRSRWKVEALPEEKNKRSKTSKKKTSYIQETTSEEDSNHA